MNFRSFEDLAGAVRRGLSRLPHQVDVVVGLPRSGLIPALLIALYKNAMVTDLEGLIAGRGFPPGKRREKPALLAEASKWRHVLVVDDSVDTGGTFRDVGAALRSSRRGWTVTTCAVYGAAAQHAEVDLVLEHCPQPRIFEWNLVHHPGHMRSACLDIDGVLCLDPSKDENDDGPAYARFLENACPNLVPSVPVGTLVTSRLEKHRGQTEDWLGRNGVVYDELYMLDLPSAAERRRLGAHAPFKAEVYAEKRDSSLFLESESRQAKAIARITGKPVICTDTMRLFGGPILPGRRTIPIPFLASMPKLFATLKSRRA